MTRRYARLATLSLIALASCGDSSSTTLAATSTAASVTTPPATTTFATSSTSTTRTVVTTATTATTARPTTAGAVPAPVTVVRAGPAGGSGEINVIWSGVAGATGYRVARATAVGGPFTTSADYDVATGTSVKSTGVTNVFLASDKSFVYVEAMAEPGITDRRRYFHVTAYNTAGAAAPSTAVCGTPPGAPPC